MGLAVPAWMKAHSSVMSTGMGELDQILSVLLKSELVIGFSLAAFLDNTLPGELIFVNF